ncbi:helix-turn-helix transcriptional regulator [Herbiconiux sp. VKM Ac-1786]|uniref:winged helix-turn-helix transcriptional regulator n=1 Tax=Herbiconiux sp. VKM Ac-1786 TaxID=2783824 RepID=UPI00188C95A1|nr:helix-turn-helix domain-containing protein [Herbiconiux sp. VKM Ac-1786]MBF4573934.1 helix-turn-helix transcriptional regulator [Herbiconiux sp. VKM Ac-1786]
MAERIWDEIHSDTPSIEGNPFAAGCLSRVVLDHVTSKWGVLVLAALAAEPMRWGQLHRYVEGISEKMLAQTLRQLEGDGFVLRQSAGTVPPRVDYSLTPLGAELAALLIPLVRWVGDNVQRTGLAQPSALAETA